jgi:hypothetical protein
MSEKSRSLLLGLAASHLILVALSAARVDLGLLGPPGVLLDEYGLLSGAGSGYGFFATGAGSELRVRFDVIDGEDLKTTTSLETAASHEADLRIGGIISTFQWEDDEPALPRALAASLAGKIFARHPEAHKVAVRLESFKPVSMEDFRRGIRPQWTSVYTAKFVYPYRKTKECGNATGLR